MLHQILLSKCFGYRPQPSEAALDIGCHSLFRYAMYYGYSYSSLLDIHRYSLFGYIFGCLATLLPHPAATFLSWDFWLYECGTCSRSLNLGPLGTCICTSRCGGHEFLDELPSGFWRLGSLLAHPLMWSWIIDGSCTFFPFFDERLFEQ